jgi:hypothetical protein
LWNPVLLGNPQPQDVSAQVELRFEGHVIATQEASGTLTCGSANIEVKVDCEGAHFSGFASGPMTLLYRLNSGQMGEMTVEGNFSETVQWDPILIGDIQSQEVSAQVELVFGDRVIATEEINQIVDCGSANVEVKVDCVGAHFSGSASRPMMLAYRLSDGQTGEIAVEGDFSETIQWTADLSKSYSPHDLSAQANLIFEGQTISSDEAGGHFSCNLPQLATCQLIKQSLPSSQFEVNLGAVSETGQEIPIRGWRATGEAKLLYQQAEINSAGQENSAMMLPVTVSFPSTPGNYRIQFEVLAEISSGLIWAGGSECRLEYEESRFVTGQYQDFIGAVPFGTFTPNLEAGKEYFDGPRSLMYNVEFIQTEGQSDIVFRFNGQELSDVTTSLFYAGSFDQVESSGGRATTTLNEGITKLIAYRYGAEQARIFQTLAGEDTRWIHPLDQPFEFKYDFQLELHGPANTNDILIYGNQGYPVQYDANGLAVLQLNYDQPGLIAIYHPVDDSGRLTWNTAGQVTFPIIAAQTVTYQFDEIGLYHYRIVDQIGQVIAGPAATSNLQFTAEPGLTYQAQLVYPMTSLFAGLYDDMKFEHPDYWLMPIDGRSEHAFEFHLDYHRLPDPDLGNDHRRGDVVVDGLTLSYGTTSVAQQFPYGRHDGARPGVNIVGIPNVSVVAFCQRPGYHEVVYWGGWENESYYLPERSWVFDQELAEEWNEDQRGECIDAALRVNMELARQGLRTDHTFRHHGERSQGYQMVQQHLWSPYNLVGMRPPHLGQILKSGALLPYYENAEDILFWGWDLDRAGLADGIDATALQRHIASLGPAIYVDQTGIHPAAAVYVPEFPAEQPTPTPGPIEPTPSPEPAAETSEPAAPVDPAIETPEPAPSPEPATETPEPAAPVDPLPPIIQPAPEQTPQT